MIRLAMMPRRSLILQAALTMSLLTLLVAACIVAPWPADGDPVALPESVLSLLGLLTIILGVVYRLRYMDCALLECVGLCASGSVLVS